MLLDPVALLAPERVGGPGHSALIRPQRGWLMAGMSADQSGACSPKKRKVGSPNSVSYCSNWSRPGDDETLVRSIFREVHTLKGSSAVAGLDDVSRVAHDLEELVDTCASGDDQ